MADRLAHIPGDGSLLELPRMMRDPLAFLRARHRRYGDLFKTRWIVPIVIAVGPEANRAIFVTRREAFSIPRGYGETAFGRVFAGSLVLQEGEAHRYDRELVRDALGSVALAETVDGISAVWSRAAHPLGDGRPHDVYHLLRAVTFEVAANVLLGLDLDATELGRWQPLFEALIAGTDSFGLARIPFLRLDRAIRARESLIERLIPRVERARTHGGRGVLHQLAHHKARDGQPLSPRRVAEHLLLLFWAGFDTTAASGSWLLAELAQAPAWQERLVDEQRRVGGGGTLTRDQFSELRRQGNVLKEIERLHPPALINPRRTEAEVELGGKLIPRDTRVFYSAFLTHRDERTYANPDVFDPSRWEARADDAPAAGTLVGFGGGPRVCVGKSFALLQLRVMLATVLGRFRLRLDDRRPIRPTAFTMHRPIGALVQFESA
jgi:cytochrome P450